MAKFVHWRKAACWNFEFSFPCHGKWLIPQLSLLHEIYETWACNECPAHSTIGKALSLCQLCSFKWRIVSHMSVCPFSSLVLCMSRFVETTSNRWNRGTLGPNLLFPNLISLKTASGSFRNCRCSMKLLRKGSATNSSSLDAACWRYESHFLVPKKMESLVSSCLPTFWYWL